MKQETDKAKEKRKQLSDTSETKKAKMPSYTKFDGDSDAQSTESETEEPEPDLGTASAPQPELDDATRTLLVRTIFTEVLLDVTKQLTQLVATQVLVAAVAKTQAAKATSAAAPKKEAEKRPLGGLVGYGSSSDDESDQSDADEGNPSKTAGRGGQPPRKERRRNTGK